MASKSAAYWIEKLKLEKHFLEWGYFKETLRDENMVTTKEGKQRSASTLIYFLSHLSSPFHFQGLIPSVEGMQPLRKMGYLSQNMEKLIQTNTKEHIIHI